jgi:hypothetical protein
MATVKATFRPAKLRLLEVRYVCDLQRDSDVIPLGVLTDLALDNIWGLGLVARKYLSADEEAKIGSLVRADFAAPFTYLHGIFDAVIKSKAPAQSFAALVQEHTHSLRFKPLDDVTATLPRPLVAASIDARRLWAKDELISHGNTAYWKMFPEYVPDAVDKGVEEETRELKAAA